MVVTERSFWLLAAPTNKSLLLLLLLQPNGILQMRRILRLKLAVQWHDRRIARCQCCLLPARHSQLRAKAAAQVVTLLGTTTSLAVAAGRAGKHTPPLHAAVSFCHCLSDPRNPGHE